MTSPCWLQLFRLLWLYSTLYGLAGLGTRADQYPYPESWRLALGRIAAASPFLVAGQSGVLSLLVLRLERTAGQP